MGVQTFSRQIDHVSPWNDGIVIVNGKDLTDGYFQFFSQKRNQTTTRAARMIDDRRAMVSLPNEPGSLSYQHRTITPSFPYLVGHPELYTLMPEVARGSVYGLWNVHPGDIVTLFGIHFDQLSRVSLRSADRSQVIDCLMIDWWAGGERFDRGDVDRIHRVRIQIPADIQPATWTILFNDQEQQGAIRIGDDPAMNEFIPDGPVNCPGQKKAVGRLDSNTDVREWHKSMGRVDYGFYIPHGAENIVIEDVHLELTDPGRTIAIYCEGSVKNLVIRNSIFQANRLMDGSGEMSLKNVILDNVTFFGATGAMNDTRVGRVLGDRCIVSRLMVNDCNRGITQQRIPVHKSVVCYSDLQTGHEENESEAILFERQTEGDDYFVEDTLIFANRFRGRCGIYLACRSSGLQIHNNRFLGTDYALFIEADHRPGERSIHRSLLFRRNQVRSEFSIIANGRVEHGTGSLPGDVLEGFVMDKNMILGGYVFIPLIEAFGAIQANNFGSSVLMFERRPWVDPDGKWEPVIGPVVGNPGRWWNERNQRHSAGFFRFASEEIRARNEVRCFLDSPPSTPDVTTEEIVQMNLVRPAGEIDPEEMPS